MVIFAIFPDRENQKAAFLGRDFHKKQHAQAATRGPHVD
jgi:hypothetical protein